jgi:hypothetical protein
MALKTATFFPARCPGENPGKISGVLPKFQTALTKLQIIF